MALSLTGAEESGGDSLITAFSRFSDIFDMLCHSQGPTSRVFPLSGRSGSDVEKKSGSRRVGVR